MSTSYESCPPEAGALINSLRAFGYDLSMAIADLIDNSVFAKAKRVSIDYDWNAGSPWIRIVDDGVGMPEATLREAMRLGSQSPLEEREEADLGRFGLGLKTASFSQCKVLTVRSKTASSRPATRSWDLEHVRKTGKWDLAKTAPRGAAELLSVLAPLESGTVVVWQHLDRVVGEGAEDNDDCQDLFISRFDQVVKYLEIVFHRYLTGRGRLHITVGRHECQPWDPFLESNQFTQRLAEERPDNGRFTVTPYVLPHVSKRSKEETVMGSGLYGWNAHQGFYVYRNRRMIILGGYLDFELTPEEHFKLCRIRVDLPNNLDHEWGIDVRKAAASPPGHVRGHLLTIAKATRAKAVNVYRARTGPTPSKGRGTDKHTVWLKVPRRGKIVYRINRKNEAIRRILDEVDTKKSWVSKLFHLIENTVPHRLIIMDNAEHEDCHVNLPESVAPPPEELLALCRSFFEERVMKGVDPHDAADYACSYFDNHVGYRVMLDTLIEGME